MNDTNQKEVPPLKPEDEIRGLRLKLEMAIIALTALREKYNSLEKKALETSQDYCNTLDLLGFLQSWPPILAAIRAEKQNPEFMARISKIISESPRIKNPPDEGWSNLRKKVLSRLPEQAAPELPAQTSSEPWVRRPEDAEEPLPN
jgi:hypothetical protein